MKIRSQAIACLFLQASPFGAAFFVDPSKVQNPARGSWNSRTSLTFSSAPENENSEDVPKKAVQFDLDPPLTPAGVPEKAPSTLQLANDANAAASTDSTRDTSTSPLNGLQSPESIWDSLSPVTIQGLSLRTWSFAATAVKRALVLVKSDGRPVNADVELWQGPDYTPLKLALYLENGNERPFSAVIETPYGSNTIAVRNTAYLEFPLDACVEGEMGSDSSLLSLSQELAAMGTPKTVQGGAIKTWTFSHVVESIQILIETNGRPLNARIELLQGPNNIKQVMEIQNENGMDHPFYCVIQAPGYGNVVRIVNTATMEFPLTANVEPYVVDPEGEAIFHADANSEWNGNGNSFGLLDRY